MEQEEFVKAHPGAIRFPGDCVEFANGARPAAFIAAVWFQDENSANVGELTGVVGVEFDGVPIMGPLCPGGIVPLGGMAGVYCPGCPWGVMVLADPGHIKCPVCGYELGIIR